jgi:8-oxo-dGTP pyrophosphatase MutT (NUDIX family)
MRLPMPDDPLVTGKTALAMSDAVAAVILVEGDGYLMQLRDPLPQIWYPNRWGLFGGGVEPGEDPVAALARELREELELELKDAQFFTRFDFDLGGIGLRRYFRIYYTVAISRAESQRLVLHEGAAMRVFPGPEILTQPLISPYDEFALFLHYGRARLGATRP